jgi:guanylate kinase
MEASAPVPSVGKLVLIIGPSGVGKSVVLRRLRQTHPSYHFPRSATTRPRRPGEGDELYRFVTEEEFDRLLQADAFIETAIVHGAARYGTLKEEILPHIEAGRTVVREVDVQGFDAIRSDPLFAGNAAPYRLQSIFIVPENTEQLVRRITRRAPISEAELARRIASMERELVFADGCTDRIVNIDGKLEETIREVETAIAARSSCRPLC